MDPSSSISMNQGTFVQANGLHMYYETHGTGTPVILLHGGTVNCQMWAPFLNLFSKNYQLITPDSRAHGRTDNPTGAMSYRLMAEDIAQFIQALGLHRPFVGGYSDGGLTALEMAMNYPGLTRGYMIGGIQHTHNEAYFELMRGILGMVSPGVVDFERLIQTNSQLIPDLQEQHDIFKTPGYWKTYLEQMSKQWMIPLTHTPADFAKITDPVLFFCGDRDAANPPEQNLEMYRMVKGSELAVLLNADHWSIAQQFDLVVAMMDNFMKRVTKPV